MSVLLDRATGQIRLTVWQPDLTWRRAQCRLPAALGQDPLPELLSDPVGPTPSADDPRAGAIAGALGQVVLEVLAGRRPISHLDRVFARAPLTTLRHYVGQKWWRHAGLAGVRVSQPCEDAVEASLRFATHDRSVAAALRLDQVNQRWICTCFEVLAPRR